MKKILLSIFVLIGLFVFVSCDNTNKNNYTSDNYDWKTPQTDKLKLTQSYEGKDFIKDGIGEVTPIRYVDGDTTIFKTSDVLNLQLVTMASIHQNQHIELSLGDLRHQHITRKNLKLN